MTDQPTITPAEELIAKHLPPTRWVVESILPEGFCLFAGDPKRGKSFIALQLAMATSWPGFKLFGGYRVTEGRALYVDLDLGPRKSAERLREIKSLSGQGRSVDNLLVTYDWPRFGRKGRGMAKLNNYLTANPDTVLVVLDTLGLLLPSSKGGNVFVEDYSLLGKLSEMANKHHACILCVHHLHKGAGKDKNPLDRISGSKAFQAAADTIWTLERESGEDEATLWVVGNETVDRSLHLWWEVDKLSWRL